jgi:DNA-binding transcriptional MocR family regulator
MNSHIGLPKRVNLKSFVYHLHKEGIYLDSVERNYLDDFYHERILKLNVSNVDAHRIEEGIRKIASALKNPQNYFL